MGHTAKQNDRSADNTVTRVISTQTKLSQAQLQVLATKLDQQISLELKNRGHLIIRYDATSFGFTQVLLQLQQLGIQVRDSRWFHIKTGWYDFVDHNVASQASQRLNPCCNRVPRM
ncbi:MAG: hypothetical protein ABL885_15575 [Methylophilaceae bacterium]